MNKYWEWYHITNIHFICYWILILSIVTFMYLSIRNGEIKLEEYKKHMIKTDIAEYNIDINGNVHFKLKKPFIKQVKVNLDL